MAAEGKTVNYVVNIDRQKNGKDCAKTRDR